MDERTGADRVERVGVAAGRGPSAPLVAGIGLLAIAIALLKPWALAEPATPARVPATSAAARASLAPTAVPSPTVRVLTAESAAAGLCFGIADWRVVATETWADRTVRVWMAADGAHAGGQLDRAVTFTPVLARGVPALGFCAPVTGPDRPPDGAMVTLWRIDGDEARPLSPLVVEPPTATPFGRLWAAPGSSGGADATWPSGRYVVGIAAPSYVRWLGIEVILAGPP